MLTTPNWLMPVLLSPMGLLIPLAPRSGPLLVLLIGIAGIVHYIRHRPSLDWLKTKSAVALLVLLAYFMASGLWSQTPERSFEHAFRIIALAFFGIAGLSLMRSLSDEQKQRISTILIPALIVGIFTGCIYGLVQYTGPSIRLITDFLGTSPEFSDIHANDTRLHLAKTMLLTNLAFFALLPWLWQKQKLTALVAYGGLVTVCIYSDSQSSLVACLVGGLAFCTLKISTMGGAKIIMAGIIASFVLVIPITQSSLLGQAKEKIEATSLGKKTAPDVRLEVYQLFSSLILNKPIFGHGFMAGVKYEGDMAGVDYEKVNLNVRTPHNAHLQTIFDTGFVGTALLLLALLWPVWHALKAGRGATAFCLLLPLCVMIGSTSFSFVIWREWIPGATILMVFFLLLSRDKTA